MRNSRRNVSLHDFRKSVNVQLIQKYIETVFHGGSYFVFIVRIVDYVLDVFVPDVSVVVNVQTRNDTKFFQLIQIAGVNEFICERSEVFFDCRNRIAVFGVTFGDQLFHAVKVKEIRHTFDTRFEVGGLFIHVVNIVTETLSPLTNKIRHINGVSPNVRVSFLSIASSISLSMFDASASFLKWIQSQKLLASIDDRFKDLVLEYACSKTTARRKLNFGFDLIGGLRMSEPIITVL